MRKTAYDPITPYDTNLVLARVLNGHQTYWAKNGATVRYHHEPAPHWSWTTPDGAGHSAQWENAFAAVTNYLA